MKKRVQAKTEKKQKRPSMQSVFQSRERKTKRVELRNLVARRAGYARQLAKKNPGIAVSPSHIADLARGMVCIRKEHEGGKPVSLKELNWYNSLADAIIRLLE